LKHIEGHMAQAYRMLKQAFQQGRSE
jgi:hypothetical protein